MNRSEALTAARALVAEVGKTRVRRGSLVDEVGAVLAVAGFLVDDQPAEVGHQVDARPMPEDAIPCAIVPGDWVGALGDPASGLVGVSLHAESVTGAVAFGPADARRFAAQVLNAADAAEGDGTAESGDQPAGSVA